MLNIKTTSGSVKTLARFMSTLTTVSKLYRFHAKCNSAINTMLSLNVLRFFEFNNIKILFACFGFIRPCYIHI